jgi:prepilin-type N-terminal cleavage/methylation domain-containing protein
MALAKFKFNRNDGFSLVETMVATTLLAVALTALAELFAVSVKNNNVARNGTFTSVLAAQKMEQLRGLTWGFDTLGLPISDISTDTAKSPEFPTGGKGLAPSPSNTLRANTDGYVDYLDGNGVSLGGGTVIPDGTAYIRRWLIEPLPTNPNNTLIIQVLVTRRRDRGTADAGSVARAPEEARMITVKTRKAQ